MKTYAEQLESVQTAIEEIETKGQTVSDEQLSLNRADLNTLYAREQYLRKMATREARGGGARVRQVTPNG